MASPNCPEVAKVSYERVIARHYSKTTHLEAVAKQAEMNREMNEDVAEFLALTSIHQGKEVDPESFIFEYGENYDWSGAADHCRDTNGDGGTWLLTTVELSRQEEHDKLDLPMKKDEHGVLHHFEIDGLKADQKEVMAHILNGIHEWVNYVPVDDHGNSNPAFRPIRVCVRGEGGSGKSVLLKTITSTVRRMFGSRNAVHVGGPTGASSFNAGGVTDHFLFGVNTRNANSKDVSAAKMNDLLVLFEDTIVLLFDERSMISSKLFGKMEATARTCAHGGFYTSDNWGHIPVVIMFGDDYQLPSFEKGVTFIPLTGSEHIRPPVEYNPLSLAGQEQFLCFATDVMDLPSIKRQNDNETEFKNLLQQARHDDLDEHDVKHLRTFHIGDDTWTKAELEEIQNEALWVFANKEPMKRHNMKMLQATTSAFNPVARIHTKSSSRNMLHRPVKSHFHDSSVPPSRRLCSDARVCIDGRNFKPRWGLYNGAIGTVSEIHFKDGQNPNHGHMPEFVVVEFPQYTGPTWDNNNPQVRTEMNVEFTNF
jgi:ABC-type dipeptide/oligopeptide/nickel transport system ATPase component